MKNERVFKFERELKILMKKNKSKRTDSLEEFIEKLCESLAKYADSYFKQDHVKHKSPLQIEFYNAPIEILSPIKSKAYTRFWIINSPFFNSSSNLRSYSDILEVKERVYYINVGWFFEVYEKRKSQEEAVIF